LGAFPLVRMMDRCEKNKGDHWGVAMLGEDMGGSCAQLFRGFSE
jgi:hypothetical protein